MTTFTYKNVKPGDVLKLDYDFASISNLISISDMLYGSGVTGNWNADFTEFTVESISNGNNDISFTLKGLDLSSLSLGDKFTFGKYQVENEDPWPIDWEIVHQTDEYQIAQTEKIIDIRCFDASETGRGSSSYMREGWNHWDVSNIEQWLNSDQATWYSSQHSYDMPPNSTCAKYTPYETHKGFLYYFSDTEKSYLQDMALSIKSSTNSSDITSWTGKVWLPTYSQVFGGENSGVNEGTRFSIYSTGGSILGKLHKMCAENSNYRDTAELSENQIWRYWTCSVGTSTDAAVRSVETNGGTANIVAAAGFCGIRPCIKLPRVNYNS